MGSIQEEPKYPHDYKDWPNAAGFNATEIYGDTQTPISLKITGHFPNYVAGSLYRTGPGAYKIPRSGSSGKEKSHFTLSHWFDGFTTTHRFDLIAGDDDKCSEIRYSSRLQGDELVEKARETGKLDVVSFGQKRDPCDTLYKKFKSVFTSTMDRGSRTNNVGVTLREPLPVEMASLSTRDREGRRLMTLGTDNSFSKVFDVETLEPLGVTDQSQIHPALTGPLSAAHPSQDPKTGDIFNYNLIFGQSESIWRASPSGKTEILATIKGPGVRGAYIHSLLLTDNFVILCVWPAYFQDRGAKILWERNLLDAMKFDPNSEATWYVIDRHHGRGVVKKFKSAPFFCFHTTNAWEEPRADGGSVDLICELVERNNMDIVHHLYYENMISTSPHAPAWRKKSPEAALARIVRHRLVDVPLFQAKNNRTSSKSTTPRTTKILSLEAGDLPRFNPNYALKPHRYVYTVLDRSRSSFLDGLGKTDTATGATIVWERERHTPGEPVLVPKPGAVDEDDGVVLCVVLDGDAGTSYLLCLDARTFEEVGRAGVSKAVGFGFHGVHVSNAVS